MSSLRVLLGCQLSSALKRRLAVSSVTSKCRLSSYNLSRQFQSSSAVAVAKLVTSEKKINDALRLSKVHTGVTRNRNDARIDESLNRLDGEIRRVGRIRRQEVDDILEDIKEMKKATSSQSLMIIRCCGELIPEEPPSSRTQLVQQVWKTLENLKVPMDVSHYNALLRVYLENEHKFNPTEFLQDLTAKGVEPNRVTYQRLIARFCQEGDIDGASTILQHMKEKQMPINEYVFNSLVLGHGHSNDMESAEGILNVMKQAGLEPNDDTYVTLMTCYAKHGDIGNIHRIVKECEEKEIFLIDRDFLNVIHSLAENNHHQLIDEILPYLKKHSGFNQEATNLVFRLVNIGQEDTAFKILKQMTPIVRQDEQLPSGIFFLKHLVHLNRPSELIFKYCKALQDEGLNKYALHRACEAALLSRKFDLAVDLFEGLRATGHPIRQHYFWPMFTPSSSEKDIQFGLKCMRDLGVAPNTETLRDYVIPNVLGKKKESFQKSLEKLSASTGISLSSIASSAMLHLLSQDEIKLAADFASTYRIRIGFPHLRRAVVETYRRTKDATSFVKIIGGSATADGDDSAREYIGVVLMDLVDNIRSSQNKAAQLEPVLKELLAQGLGLSNSGSELLQNNLGEALTPELANAIIQLTSDQLTPKISFAPDTGSARRFGGPMMLEDKSSEELEQMLAEAKRRNGPTKGIKKSLLYSYCRDRNIEKMEAIKEELSKDDFVFTAGLHAMFLDAYTSAGKLDEAKASYLELKKELDFVMDDLKLLRYATLIHSTGDYDGCLEVLKDTPRNEQHKPQGAMQQATVWKLLNSVADTSPEKVKEVFNILNDRKLTPVNTVTLGPLVKAYLIKDDLPGALQEFERCVQEYRVTPWKQELFCRFIKLEDAERLQKVMDFSTNIHGEVNSMYDLVFAFIDCGKLRQAKKILETPGLRARNDKIEMYCQRYCQENRIGELENLIQVTKDLFDVDRNAMYFYLLQAYCKQGDADKALSVWTSLQEENVQPSPELLIYLADFLQKNNRPVPFVVPDESEMSPPEAQVNEPSKAPKAGLPKSIVEFKQCIDLNDIDRALQIKQRLDSEGSPLGLTDKSQLIEKLARAERLNEATRLTEELFENGLHPLRGTLRFLAGRLASSGDINSLERMSDKLNDSLKRGVMFNSRVCLAYANSGRAEEYIENYLRKTVESASSSEQTSESSTGSTEGGAEEQEEVGNIPVFGCTTLLLKNEHLVPAVEDLTAKAQHFTHRRALSNALWGYYMSKKEFEKAKEIWDSQLKNEARILFRGVLLTSRANNDSEVAQATAAQVLTGENIIPRAKAVACSFALDALGNEGKVDEALKLLEESLKTVKLEDYPATPLIKLKEQAEAENKKFPYTIPTTNRVEGGGRRRRRAADSSDSDSD